MIVPGMSPRNGGGLLQEQELLWDTLSGMLDGEKIRYHSGLLCLPGYSFREELNFVKLSEV